MKRLFIFNILLFAALSVFGQPAVVTMIPSDADAFTENVQLIFDCKGTVMEGESEAWLWSWATGANPAEMKICGTEWGNILPSAQLQAVEGESDKWHLTLPLTVDVDGTEVTYKNLADLFFIAPGKLTTIGFLIRTQDGSKQTDGDMATSVTVSPLVFIDKELRSFPSKVSAKDVVTVVFNQSLSTDEQVKIMKDIVVTVELLDESGTAVITSEDNSTKDEGNNMHSFTFFPAKLGDLPGGTEVTDLKKFRATYKGYLLNADETTTEVTVSFEQDFQPYE